MGAMSERHLVIIAEAGESERLTGRVRFTLFDPDGRLLLDTATPMACAAVIYHNLQSDLWRGLYAVGPDAWPQTMTVPASPHDYAQVSFTEDMARGAVSDLSGVLGLLRHPSQAVEPVPLHALTDEMLTSFLDFESGR